MSRLVLDAGAFVAFERGDSKVRLQLAAAHRLGLEVTTPSPVVSQVWRDGRRQAMLAHLLRAIRVEAPDESAARRAGELLAKTRTSDAVDALLVALTQDGDTVVTSDPGDIERLLTAAGTRAAVLAVSNVFTMVRGIVTKDGLGLAGVPVSFTLGGGGTMRAAPAPTPTARTPASFERRRPDPGVTTLTASIVVDTEVSRKTFAIGRVVVACTTVQEIIGDGFGGPYRTRPACRRSRPAVHSS